MALFLYLGPKPTSVYHGKSVRIVKWGAPSDVPIKGG